VHTNLHILQFHTTTKELPSSMSHKLVIPEHFLQRCGILQCTVPKGSLHLTSQKQATLKGDPSRWQVTRPPKAHSERTAGLFPGQVAPNSSKQDRTTTATIPTRVKKQPL
jgi:hypothetical protein